MTALPQPAGNRPALGRPGVLVINPGGAIQIVDVSNVPFMRPDLEGVLAGIQFHRDNGFPIRGTHKVA